jgi:hypothetical protein
VFAREYTRLDAEREANEREQNEKVRRLKP